MLLTCLKQLCLRELDTMAHTCSPSTQDTVAGGRNSEFEANLFYTKSSSNIVRPCLKKLGIGEASV